MVMVVAWKKLAGGCSCRRLAMRRVSDGCRAERHLRFWARHINHGRNAVGGAQAMRLDFRPDRQEIC
jgi:hypothetical protein